MSVQWVTSAARPSAIVVIVDNAVVVVVAVADDYLNFM